jgi:hypothetical protein
MVKHTRLWLAFFICLFVISLTTPFAQAQEAKTQKVVYLNLNILITDINLENHTLTADVSLQMDGLQLLTFGDTPQKTDNITVRFDNIGYNDLSAEGFSNYGNGTFGISTTAHKASWYLISKGETYPYDVNYAVFEIADNNFLYSVNGQPYGATSQYNYTYQINYVHVDFSGPNRIDLIRTWQINWQVGTTGNYFNYPYGQELNVYLTRNGSVPSPIIMYPVIALLFLTLAISLMSGRKNLKINFYTAVLVFSPMFIFAIQSFLPPRALLSFPESLTVMLIVLSSFLIGTSISNFKQWINYILEIIAYAVMLYFLVGLVSSISTIPNVVGLDQMTILLSLVVIMIIFSIGFKVRGLIKKAQGSSNGIQEEKKTCLGWDGDC